MLAGCFGILHDQITYSISPEYFTRMKFDQFRSADFGFHPRVFVGIIGFLATWWVGLIAGWFLARLALRKFDQPWRHVVTGLLLIMLLTLCSGACGYLAGPFLLTDRSGWNEALDSMGVLDREAFCRVAAIHLAGYCGAFLGWLLIMVKFWKKPTTKTRMEPTGSSR